MKLAKKMLASALALAMVAALALTAFAAAPSISLVAGDAKVGEDVVVTMSAANMAGLEAGDLIFEYDAEVLEFKKIAKAADATYDMGVGGSKEAGKATWSFIYSEVAEEDSGIVVLTFKALKAGDGNVKVTIKSWDGNEGKPAVADSYSVVVKEDAPETTEAPAETTEAPVVEDASAEDASEEAAETTAKVVVTTSKGIDQSGEAGVAAIAGVMALAAVAFVATRKKDEE